MYSVTQHNFLIFTSIEMPNEQISAKNASNGLFDSLITLKTPPQIGFLKFYVMGSTEIHLYGIAHVKVDFIPPPKRYVMPRLGRFD